MTIPRSAGRRGWLSAALAGGAALCLTAGAHLLTEPARASVADAGSVPGEQTAPGPATSRVPAVPPALALPALALPPAAFRVPARHLQAPVVPVATDRTGALALPQDDHSLGWWVGGALPGARSGTVVLAGHVDTLQQGPGVMADVVHQPVGTQLQLRTGAGSWVTYRIAAVRSYPKTALPAGVFRGGGRARLVLVTCGGTFDEQRHHYSDNVVVYAVPDGS